MLSLVLSPRLNDESDNLGESPKYKKGSVFGATRSAILQLRHI